MKRIQYFLLAGFFLAAQACTKDFEELNKNKAGFNELDAQYQFAKVQADMSGDREDAWRYDLGIASPLIQHLGGSWWTQHGGMYQVIEKSHWFSHWETTYPRELKNLQDIIEKTKSDPAQVNINAAARIMRVLVYSKLTDMYGDIPYTEAAKGYTERKYLPKYDKQEDIYKDFFKELDEAVTQLKTDAAPVGGDAFFDGDVAKWKKFGNSLRLRLGFRLTKRDLVEAKKQVEAAISKGVMTSIEDIAMLSHMEASYVAGENRGNGRSQVFKAEPRSSGFRIVRTLIDTMSVSNDPRLYIFGGTYFGDGTIGTKQVVDISRLMPAIGIVPGAMAWNLWSDYGTITGPTGAPIVVTQNDKFMQPSKYVSALNAPFFHLTPAEVEFLLAEAALRGWGGVTNAEQHFKNGLQLACEAAQLYPGAPVITATAIEAFKNHYLPFPADFDGAMKTIHTQMWVNFFLNGTEAYANWRRTGYPLLNKFTSVEWYSAGAPAIPRRFYYPESEIIQNPKNYQEAVDRLGGADDWLKPVWWDKQ